MLRIARILKKLDDNLDLNLNLILREGTHKEFPRMRDLAYTFRDENKYYIVVSPKMVNHSTERIEGVLLHELAHLYLLSQGYDNHSEVEADEVVRDWGYTLNYDRQDIQTTGTGSPTRPSYLHQ